MGRCKAKKTDGICPPGAEDLAGEVPPGGEAGKSLEGTSLRGSLLSFKPFTPLSREGSGTLYQPGEDQSRPLPSLFGPQASVGFFASPESVGFLCPRVHAQASGADSGCRDASTLEGFMVPRCLCIDRYTASKIDLWGRLPNHWLPKRPATWLEHVVP